MILLDTHVLVHYATDDARLGKRARTAIERARAKDEVFVSAMSFWEIAMLRAKKRLVLETTVSTFREQVLHVGIAELVVDGEVAIAAAELPDKHADPADRILIASAIASGFTLLTADGILLGWKLRGFRTQDATE